MTKKGEKLLVRLTIVFLLISVVVMGYIRSLQKIEAQSANAAVEAGLSSESFEAIDGENADIMIPLPDAESDGFHVEEDLKNRKLTIVLEGVGEDWFYQNKIKGDQQKISQVLYKQEIGAAKLQFILNDIYKADILVEDNELCLTLKNPAEQGDKIVVLEGEAFDEDVLDALEAQGIQGLSSGDIATANELRADFFLSLSSKDSRSGKNGGTQSAQDAAQITIYYSDSYYIPEFDSRDLAELLGAYLAGTYGAENIKTVRTADEALDEAMIPAVLIVYDPSTAGTLVDADEAVEISQDDFEEQKRIASLVLEAIAFRYEEMSGES